MKSISVIVCLTLFVVLSVAVIDSTAQNLQLSYTNADVAEKLVRSATTTTPPPATTKKSTFFGGIRNLFSRKDASSTPPPPADAAVSTTPHPAASNGAPAHASGMVAIASTTARPTTVVAATPPTSSTTTTTTTTTTAAPPAPLKPAVVAAATQRPPRSRDPLHEFESVATITLSTTKKPKIKEDFPALPGPRQPAAAAAPSIAPTIGTTGNAWTARPAVSFVTTPRPSVQTGTFSSSSSSTTTTTAAPVSGLEATDTELEALTEVLFTKESSLLPLVTLDLQGRTQSSAIVDEAPLPLITVNEVGLNANPTVAAMRELYNNYEQDTSINEHVTAMERNEETAFVDALLAGPLMRHTMAFLQRKEKVTLDPKTHRDLLKTIWFSLYSRGRGKIGSSAFEHVFLTELRNGTVSGFHNWIYYYYEEHAGRANYQGWLKKVQLGTKGHIIKYRFSYNNIMKPVNAMFVGTSPELEVALYTLCFAMRADRECPVSLGGQRLTIRTHTFRYRGKNLIGSAFPEI